MGQLVLAAGHDIALAEQDVTCLMHRIRQKKAGKSMARCFLLGLNRGVAKEFCLGYQRKEREHELIQSRNRRMGENNGFLWIDAASKVVDYHIANVVLDVLCGVAVGNNLIVGNDNSRGYAFVLQRNAFLDGAEIVAQVQTTRRTIARKHRVLAGVYLKVGADCLAALLACFKTIGAHNEQCLFRLIRNGD